MWIVKCKSISVWTIISLFFCVSAVKSNKHKHVKKSGLKLPCDPLRVEIAFPIIEDSFGRKNSTFYQEVSPRDLLHITVKWRRQPLNLILYKNSMTAPQSVREWDDGNVTYAEILNKSCFYHGYIRGQKSSYVAISTCGGLGGYIQTDTELLYIQSRLEIDPHQRKAPHLIYTCEPKRVELKPSSDMKSTAGSMRKRRQKRAARRTRYLEVQVVVDYKLVLSLGGKTKTETYVIALMNIANTVYQHSSLGQDIKVVIVRIIYLSRNQQRSVMTRGYPLRTVNKFCKWSMNNIPRGRPMNYDISVLITDESLGPSGFAPITGLCYPSRSCAAIHDDGFSTGFVIAHEMAHVFGLFHDGHGNNCYGGKYQTSIMAPVVESKFNRYWWSECSKRKMAEIVPYLHCLNNKPVPIANHYPLKATQKIQEDLGKAWSLNFQCEREFGRSYGICQAFGSDPCSVLWCADTRNPYYCRTKRGPPLPGTECGPDMKCHNTRCQYVGRRSPVHGKWSAWSRWSECSSGCGVGTKERTRACNNPTPSYGGDECKGETSQRDTCYNSACTHAEDMREGECRVWDSLQIRYGTHKWLPHEPVNASTVCKQTCKSFYTREVVAIEVDVADGTPCSYLRNTGDVCIDGKCIPVGCDGKQNSSKRLDACGVCGGDGSECKVIQATVTIKTKSAHKYNKIVTLPGKARNISIAQKSTTDHFLALQDVVYGTFLLNGDKRQAKTEVMVLKGAMFYYDRGNRTHNERISSPGPTIGALEVMVHAKRKIMEVDVSFRYIVHKSDMTYEKDRFRWKFDSWSQCSVTCGEGIQTIMHKCINKQTDLVVDKSNCAALEAPRKDEVKCTRQSCSDVSFNYVMLNTFTECDAKCGETGTQKQEYECEQHFPKTKKYKKADMKFCSHLKPPIEKRSCNGTCQNEERLTFDWNSGNWSECTYSKKCGVTGQKNRTVKCITVRGGKKITKEIVTDSKCKTTSKPTATEACPVVPCPDVVTYEWETGAWSKCEAISECGMPGHKTRSVKCITVKNGKKMPQEVADDAKCNVTTKPDITEMCPGVPCPDKYQWWANKTWTKCPCGGQNSQTRKVLCHQIKMIDGEEMVRAVERKYCKITGRKPTYIRRCNGGPCPPKFRWINSESDFQECDAECGKRGKQVAKLECQQIVIWKKDEIIETVDHSFCKSEEKPKESSKVCTGPPCLPVYRWNATDEWTKCDAGCGQEAIQRRIYICQRSIKNKPFVDVANYLCSDIKNKNETKICKGPLCPLKWQIGEWSECSVTCGRGKQYRTVYCGDPDTDFDDVRCTDAPPSMSRRCNLKWCPEPKSEECKDVYSFCSFYTGLDVRCKDASFLKKCCKTCVPHTPKAASRSQAVAKKKQLKRSRKRRSKRSRRWRRYRRRHSARR